MWIERTAELRKITAALARSRLVVVHGPLGVGKTSLVAQLVPPGRGRRDVSLAECTSSEEARAALARALRLGRADATTLVRALESRADELLVVDDAERAPELLPEVVRERAAGAHVVLSTRVDPGAGERIALEPIPRAAAMALLASAVPRAARANAGTMIAALVDACRGWPLLLGLARGLLPEIDPATVLETLAAPSATPLAEVGARAVARLPRAEQAWLRALAVFPETFAVDEAAGALGTDARAALAACERLLARGVLASRPVASGSRLALAAPLRDVVGAPAPGAPLLRAIVEHAEAELARADVSARESAWERGATSVPNLELVVARTGSAALRERAATVVHRVRAALGPLRVPPAVAAVVPRAAPLALARAELARLTGDHAAARREIARALALAPPNGLLAADAHRRAAHLARTEGSWAEAEKSLQRALAAYRSVGGARAQAGEALCAAEEAFALAARGHFDDAAQRQRNALALLDRAGSASERAIARSYLAVHLHRAGRMREAEELHRAALAEHESLGAARYAAAERMHLGYVAHELGRLDEAAEALERARAAQRALGDAGLEALSCVYLARVACDRGRVSDGEQLVAEASVLLRDVESPPQHAARDVVFGHLAMERGAHRVAADAYARALARVRTPTVGFEALTGAYLATALHAAGERGAKLRKALRASERVLGGVRHPHLQFALALLAAHVRGESVAGTPPAEALASSSEVRRALRFTRAGAARPFRVQADAKLVVTPEARRVDLSRRRALRLVVVALLEARQRAPGHALSVDAVATAGWPGERLRPTAAEQRVYTAIWALRRDLFGEALLRRDDGYLLRPDVDFEIL